MAKRKWIIIGLIVLLMLSAATVLAQAALLPHAAGQEGINVNYFYWDCSRGEPADDPITLEFSPSEKPRLEKNRVLVPLRRFAEYFSYQVDYFPQSKVIKLADELGKTIEMTLGQTQTIVNGRLVSLDVPAEAVDGVTFVPLRFIAENFDLAVDWESNTHTVLIHEYAVSTPGYILDRRSISLLQRGEGGKGHHLIAEYSQQDAYYWDQLWMSVSTTAQGNDVVTIGNNYGAPHIYYDYYHVYVADGKVVAQTLNERTRNWDPNFRIVCADGSRVMLGDGESATVYDDLTLEAVAQYDLQALCADVGADNPIWYQNSKYDIVCYGGDYLLLRGSLNKLHLVAYLDSKQVDIVYKEVFSTKEQELFEGRYQGGGPSGASVVTLQFEGESDGFLIFNCNLDNVQGHDAEYRYKIK